jgi:hypothetical protein
MTQHVPQAASPYQQEGNMSATSEAVISFAQASLLLSMELLTR